VVIAHANALLAHDDNVIAVGGNLRKPLESCRNYPVTGYARSAMARLRLVGPPW
jgi:hypothetical protein